MNSYHFSNSLFGIVEDHGIEQLSLDKLFLTSPHSIFFFRMKGEAMAPLIAAGDILVIDRSLKVESEQLILAQGNFQGEKNFFCRKIFFQKNPARIILRPENKFFPTLEMQREDELDIFGVVTGQVRKYL